MDVNQIRELIKMVESSDVAEVVIEEGENKVTIRKSGVTVAAPDAAPVASSSAAAPPAEAAPAASGDRPATWKTVTAPMVGTFYEAPSPGAAPFVQVGDEFTAGQALCIVEAMKLMNEINAEEAGVVREIAVSNGDSVEYGTVLFYYESVS